MRVSGPIFEAKGHSNQKVFYFFSLPTTMAIYPALSCRMPVEIITKQDLEDFRIKLLQDIKELLSGKTEEPKKWLKSYQVRNLLKISPGTLQNLRINGTLTYSKVGSIFYYRYEDILRLLEGKKK